MTIPLHTLSRMARRLGVRSDWLRAEADAGQVPAVRAGDRYLFDPASVESTLRDRACKPLAAIGTPSATGNNDWTT